MYNFMLAAAVAFVAFATPTFAGDAKKPDGKCLDGAWTVVCYEKSGEAQAEAKGMTVKAENGTITCSGKDGKPAMTIKVVLGENGTIQVTEQGADTSTAAPAARAGVYVLTNDLLAISLNAEAAPANADKATTDAANKNRCSIVLKREGAK
ncbi:hypothetical protein [Frigoriglobus tundricola]|uniref:Lipocalin-like domain-containing protein n=1 Tax=Frigoriglobus tundricola TaxID=2774151 RepID=A0A6M5YY31_9BACT|nr:hypothetical protein [Frigoriglobus tundricola]QJW98390.1 hypothetical protein FTUN_5980 [Frigoriglobus tundricola]